ncbi:unnamed protein product [marine sediment metagenome]|uniref:Uncharacterized protein n=1 Tax=marine sediment metagenome TaxID=412755 RepID=X0URD1_9ZZZZ
MPRKYVAIAKDVFVESNRRGLHWDAPRLSAEDRERLHGVKKLTDEEIEAFMAKRGK